MTARPKCFEETDVRLTGGIRKALNTLRAASTKHEHTFHGIDTALGKLPEVHEPGGGECACFGEAHAGTATQSRGGGAS